MTSKSIPLACAAAFAAFAAVPLAAQGQGPYTVVETGQGYVRLQDAINAIGAGRGTIRIAPGRYADCGVQTQGEVAYVAAEPGRTAFDGVVCEDKAALVLRGRRSHVEGLIFTGMRSSAKNGAGIRIETGNLSVSQSWFRDSEQGIMSANDSPNDSIVVDKSTFSKLGTCEGGGCSHSIYAGRYGSLTVTRSRFEAGTGGHYLKSRTPTVAILSNSFDDTAGHATNYMIDLCEGSTGKVANNWFVQGRDKENYSAFIIIGAEGLRNSADGLAIEGNDARIAPGVNRSTAFVADFSGQAIRIAGNTLGAGLTRYEKR